MIVSVTDFDIKSPLPPRQVPVVDNTDPTVITPDTVVTDVPVKTTEEEIDPIKPKKSSLGKLLPIIGIIVLLGLIALVVFKLLLPNLGNQANKEVKIINYWGLWEDNNVVQGLISEFESKNPGIKINYSKKSKTDYRTRLAGRLAKSGTTEDVPDVFRMHVSWLPMMKDYVEPVPAKVATDVQLDVDFFDAYKTDLKEGGKYWGIPLMYDGLSLFYNKDILTAAGVQPPKTWWGLRDLAKKLTVKDINGKLTVAGVAMGVTDNVDNWSDIIGVMLKQNGVDLFDLDSANQQKLQGVLTFYTLFRTNDQVWDESQPNSTLAFANGKLAFYFAPSWRVFDIETLNPQLAFEIVPIPQLPTLEGVDPAKIESGELAGNLTNINWSTYWVEGVNNKSSYKTEAWKFLTFLASKEGLQQFYQAASQVRSFGEIYPRKSMSQLMSGNQKLKAFVNSADSASNWYLSSRTFDDGLNDEMTKYFADAINGIVQKNSTAMTVYPDLENGINLTIQKYRLQKK